jgi:hypothetical protein
MADSTLSEYELLRLENIKRNNEVIKQLNIPSAPKKKASTTRKVKKAKTVVTPSERRSSTRKRGTVNYFVPGDEFGGDDSDYDSSNDESEEDSDDETHRRRKVSTKKATGEWMSLPLPKRGRALAAVTAAAGEPIGGITCELAKTGRSTCRKCSEAIEKGAPRVGMQAWIVGRQAVTWQHACCFLENLTVGYEESGRAKCKVRRDTPSPFTVTPAPAPAPAPAHTIHPQCVCLLLGWLVRSSLRAPWSQITGERFDKGELKVGARSHTATSFFKVNAVPPLLCSVAATVPQEQWKPLEAAAVEGGEDLEESDRDALQAVLDAASASRSRRPDDASPEKGAAAEKEATTTSKGGGKGGSSADTVVRSQPTVGSKSGAKGKVEWKWGGMVCSGILMPSRETDTHCYAKTHKGNVKTLTKGKGYWAVVG